MAETRVKAWRWLRLWSQGLEVTEILESSSGGGWDTRVRVWRRLRHKSQGLEEAETLESRTGGG